MTTQVNVKPIDEQNHLKRNALLYLVLGIIFSFSFLYNFFEQTISAEPTLERTLLFAGFVLFIVMIFVCFKVMKSANNIKKETFYCGNFQDEYLNYVNMKGYKYSFNFACFYLITIYIVTELYRNSTSDFTAVIDISNFCVVTMGLIFISYSIPVLYLLKGADDE
ncbi:MAG: hypothetical protein MJK15_01190 [Colwellia sp.]|nr:hypothetical protein [Colwellia sp.]